MAWVHLHCIWLFTWKYWAYAIHHQKKRKQIDIVKYYCTIYIIQVCSIYQTTHILKGTIFITCARNWKVQSETWHYCAYILGQVLTLTSRLREKVISNARLLKITAVTLSLCTRVQFLWKKKKIANAKNESTRILKKGHLIQNYTLLRLILLDKRRVVGLIVVFIRKGWSSKNIYILR
jgi:hypothetical protein